MTGRPTRCTKAVTTEIVRLMVEDRLSRSAAAERCSIPKGTASRWFDKGTEPHAPATYRDFRDRVTRAIRDREAAMLASIRDASKPQQIVERRTKQVLDRTTGRIVELVETVARQVPGDWRADAWSLEHLPEHKADYRSNVDVEVSGPGGGPVAVVPIVIDAEAADAMAAVLARVKIGGQPAS